MSKTPYKSRVNSTVTPLGAGASFIGSWEDVSFFTSVIAAAKSDVAGTLYMEFSDDNTQDDADSTLTYVVDAGINEVHKLTITRQYYRVRYVNGSSAQSSFEVTTLVGQHGTLSAPLNLGLQQDADSIAVRAIENEQDIAEGKRSGYYLVNKFGSNPNVSSSGNEDVVETSTIYAGQPTGSAETITITSGSSNDTLGGSGAEKLYVYGLDENYELQEEEFNMNGASGTTSTSLWSRVFRTIVTQSANGANTAFNAGAITVKHTTTTANVFSVMLAGTNQTRLLAYTVPAGYTMYMRYLRVAVNRTNNSNVTGAIRVREFGKPPRYIRNFVATNAYAYEDRIYGGLSFPEKTDLTIRILTCSANSTGVLGRFDAVVVKD